MLYLAAFDQDGRHDAPGCRLGAKHQTDGLEQVGQGSVIEAAELSMILE